MKKCFILLMVLCLFSSSSNGQKNPVKIIFDTDMAADCEDMNALCLLHAFADEGEAEIIATVACGYETNRASGATIDAINTFYNRPDIPVGTYKLGWHNMSQAMPFGNSSWTPVVRDNYPHDVPDDDKCPSSLSIYRKVLSEQPDHSVVIVTTGWLVNLRDLLHSEPDSISSLSGKDLIRVKVKELSVMGGAFPEGWEYNFAWVGVGRATKDVVENWPDEVPIMFSGFEIGQHIISGEIYKDQLPDSPLRIGLESHGNTLSAGRMSWDETSVIYAVRGLSYNGNEYWKKQSKGCVFVNDSTGFNKWLPSPDKNQSYLIESMKPDSLARLMENLIIKSTKNAIKNN